LDSTGLGQGPVAGCCECGDEPSGSCATELVSLIQRRINVKCSQSEKVANLKRTGFYTFCSK
jgi:hypothetical protein